jgi:hypothetical protein
VDDGFVILPVTRYEALREAEENLQETRFEPADGEADEKQATIDALTRRLDGVCNESSAGSRDRTPRGPRPQPAPFVRRVPLADARDAGGDRAAQG